MRATGQRFARCGGTAVIETAIVMPLYLIVLFGLLYFGYATLARQRQTMAAAYSAWLPGDQHAEATLTRFLPWALNDRDDPLVAVAQPGVSGVTSGYHVLNVREKERLNDPYYGTVIKTQLVAGRNSLGGGGEDTFDRERVAVSLWNLAFGKEVQRFVWKPGQGIVQQFDQTFGPYGLYLNAQSASGQSAGGAFINADAVSPPQIGRYENMVSDMLDGGNSSEHWLSRRQATVDATYQPPSFRVVYAEQDAAPLTAGTYFASGYAQPTYKPTGTISFDVTGRGTAARLAASDPGGNCDAVLDDVCRVTGRPEPLTDCTSLDETVLYGSVSLKSALKRQ